MQATITYLLSEQAQRAQMAATGQPVARKITVVEELPPELLTYSWLIEVAPDGSVSADLSKPTGLSDCGAIGHYTWTSIDGQLDQLPSSGVQAIRDRIAAVEAKSAELVDKYAIRQEEQRKRDEQWAKDRVASEKAYAAKQLAEAEKERAKTEYISAWMARSVDADLREQFEARMLDRKDALAAIAEQELAFLPPAVSYKFCDDSNHACGGKILRGLPREYWPAWKAIKATLPQGATTVFSENTPCLRGDEDNYYEDEGDSVGPTIITAGITVPVGPFVFQREIKLG